jgi:hypothetical protein
MLRTGASLAVAMLDIDRVVPLNEASFDECLFQQNPVFGTKGGCDEMLD